MDYIGEKVFRNPEEPDVFENISSEHATRKKAYTAIYVGTLLMDQDDPKYQMMLDEMNITEEDLEAARGDQNQARRLIFDRARDKEEREYAYEHSLHSSTQEMLSGLPDIHQAYVAASYKVHLVEREINEMVSTQQITEQQALSEQGASGLSRGRELEIYRHYQTSIESQIAASRDAHQEEKAPQQPDEPELISNS